MRAESGPCPSCGARLPRAAGWCPSCGAAQGGALEIVDLTADGPPPAPTTAVVERRRHRPSIAALVTVAAIGVLVAGGAILGGSDDPDSTGEDLARHGPAVTTRLNEGGTSLPNTSPAPGLLPRTDALLLAEPSGVELVGLTAEGAVVGVHLDTGAVQTLSAPSSTFRPTPEFPIGVAAVGDDVLLVDGTTGSVSRIMTGVPPRTLVRGSPGGVVLSSDHRSLWAIEDDGSAARVDLGLGGVLPGTEVSVPAGTWPVAARSDGLLVQASSGGVYLVAPGAEPRQVGGGAFVAATDDVLAVHTCDRSLRCRIETADGATTIPVEHGYQDQGRLSYDGRSLALLTSAAGAPPHVRLVDLRTGETTDLDVPINPWGPLGSTLVWSPDDRWLLVTTASFGSFTLVDVTSGQVHSLDLAPLHLQPLADLRMATATTPA